MMKICDGCPCLNTDYEEGSTCNLEFDSDYYPTTTKGALHLSPDCDLIEVHTATGRYRPRTFAGDILHQIEPIPGPLDIMASAWLHEATKAALFFQPRGMVSSE
jgi:hypothetical protein